MEVYDELQEALKEIERLQDMDKILRNENINLKLIIVKAIRIYEKCEETQDYSTCDLDMYEVLKEVYKNVS